MSTEPFTGQNLSLPGRCGAVHGAAQGAAQGAVGPAQLYATITVQLSFKLLVSTESVKCKVNKSKTKSRLK